MKGIAALDNDFFSVKTDEDLVKESIKRILTTLPGERVGDPSFGCTLREYIFSIDKIMLEDITFVIRNAIERFEPRVTVQLVSARMDEKVPEKVNINLIVVMNKTLERISLEIPIVSWGLYE